MIKLTTTILAPAGVENTTERTIPIKKQERAIQDVAITTLKKLLKTLMAVRAAESKDDISVIA